MTTSGAILGNYTDSEGGWVPLLRGPKGVVTAIDIAGDWYVTAIWDINDRAAVVATVVPSPAR
jgi:hypothetical protein